jgi:hypothetical protein
MSVRQTRRQAALAAASNIDATPSKSPAPIDDSIDEMPVSRRDGGSSSSNGAAREPEAPATTENIFLFWPNIIGMPFSRPISA